MRVQWGQKKGYPRFFDLLNEEGNELKVLSLSLIKEGEVEECHTLEEVDERLVKGGIRYAVRCLARQALHSVQLAKKLERHRLDPLLIEKVLSYCLRQGWMDDEMWVRSKISQWQKKGKSKKEISFRLYQLGIVCETLDDGKALRELIYKKYPQLLNSSLPYKERCKKMQALLRKGFSVVDIHSFLRENNVEEQDEY